MKEIFKSHAGSNSATLIFGDFILSTATFKKNIHKIYKKLKQQKHPINHAR